MGKGFSKDTLKVKSKMCSNRIKMRVKKMENQLNLNKKTIAKLLADGKSQSARIKVEGIIREESTMKVMEWLEMMSDLVYQRINLIALEKQCPEDLMETVCSILYCAPRITEITELNEMALQFGGKYGKDWIKQHQDNRSGHVAEKIVKALSSKPPTLEVVTKKLQAIAKENDVDWDPEEEDEELNIVDHKKEDVQVDPIMVNRMVEIFTDPKTFDMTDEEKREGMATRGCNAAEAAAALHIVKEKLANKMRPVAPAVAYPAPAYNPNHAPASDGPHGPSFAPSGPSGPSFNNGPIPGPSTPPLPDQPGSVKKFPGPNAGLGISVPLPEPSPGGPVAPAAPPQDLQPEGPQEPINSEEGEGEGEGDGDLDDLEARFAALRKGL